MLYRSVFSYVQTQNAPFGMRVVPMNLIKTGTTVLAKSSPIFSFHKLREIIFSGDLVRKQSLTLEYVYSYSKMYVAIGASDYIISMVVLKVCMPNRLIQDEVEFADIFHSDIGTRSQA